MSQPAESYVPRLRAHYDQTVKPRMQEQFGYDNPMRVPRIEKIVVNMGVGEAVADSKTINAAVAELAAITGQKPVVAKARKSVANFKLREGMPIGCKVTLRRTQMYEFLDRLINIALPRVRDFRGLSDRSFDGRGNYTFGIKEQIVFPEIDYDRIDKVRGMDVTIVTTAGSNEEARSLLAAFEFPFAK